MDFDFDDLLLALHEGAYFLDRERRITFWNPAAERITGYTAEEMIGTRCSDNTLTHVDGAACKMCTALCPAATAMQTGRPQQAELYLHHRDGHRVPVHASVTPLRDARGDVVGAAELFDDISDQIAMRERIAELEKLALLDPMTQLSNRRHLTGELRARLEERARYGLSFGVVFVDLDDFKSLNDRYGHEIGDLTLRTVAATLRASARPFDLFGRWGGEEFVGIIRNVGAAELAQIADRCRGLIGATRVRAGEHQVGVTASLGATMVRSGDDPDSLVRRADELMYESKRQGKDRISCDAE